MDRVRYSELGWIELRYITVYNIYYDNHDDLLASNRRNVFVSRYYYTNEWQQDPIVSS